MPPPPKQKRKRTPGERPPKTAPADLPPQPADDFPPRLPNETPVAYDRFCQYLLLPIPRSAARLGDKGLIHRWRSAHAWVERAAQFDATRRKRRLHALEDAQLERDLLTLAADGRLADLARGLLFGEVPTPTDSERGPLLHVMDQVARGGSNDAARLAAVRDLVELSGIGDLRKLRAKQLALPFAAPPPSAPAAPVLSEVVSALAEHATPEQLDALCGGPVVDDPPEVTSG